LTAVASPSDRVPATTEAARLFEAYSEQLFGYCLVQLGSRSEAEDAVQTTFLYALRALRRGVVPECESAWLTTIARNVCHSQRRTVHRRGPLASDVDLDTIALAQRGDDEAELLRGLKDALASMPEKQRRALVLREWHGVSPREIAGELGLSSTATHALLTRARHTFAQALALPRRQVVGLAWLIVDLRSHVKALLGGVSTKVAVTSVAVVGLGVGGIAVERSLAEPKAPPAPVQPSHRSEIGSAPTAPTVLATVPASATPSVSAQRDKTEPPRAGGARPAPDPGNAVVVPTAPLSETGAAEQQPDLGVDTLPPAPEYPADLPLDPPQLPEVDPPQVPEVDPPTHLLPPVEVPPLPPVDSPPVPPAPLTAEEAPLSAPLLP
jgi:RNA polymerase sigma-70 factor (ECF subfamily)